MDQSGMPSSVGPYRLIERIGEGGMGVVYLAITPEGGLAAVKMLRPHVLGGDDGRARFAREVATMRLVRGARVAEVLDADVRADPPYIVTRYVRGPSLAKVVGDHGPLREAALESFARGLAEALVPVHRAGLVHRDVKPGNVLLADGGPVLIDFGLARATDTTRLTAAGFVAGTPGYLAPETVLGRPPTTATDVHGWAATVVFAASGASPFGAGPDAVVMDRIRRGAADLDGVPLPWRGLLGWALSLDPQERPDLPEVLREVGSDLEGDVAGTDVGHAPWLATEPPTQVIPAEAATESPTHVLPVQAAGSPTRVDPVDAGEPPTQVVAAEAATEVWAPVGRAHRGDVAAGAPTEIVPAPAPPHPSAAATGPSWSPVPDTAEQEVDELDEVEPGRDLRTELPGLLASASAGVLVVVLFGLAPFVALGLVALLVGALRALARVERRILRRRSSRGITRGEPWIIGAATPVDLVLSVPKALAQVALAGVGGALAASVVALSGGGLRTPVLAAGVVVAALLWWGPGAAQVRQGADILRAPLRRDPRIGWVTAGILGALVLIVLLSWDSYGLIWSPATQAPWTGW